jgi:hypothetical protein
MSRFIDKLNKANRTSSAPIGFRTAQTGGGQPKILLVASVSLENAGDPGDYLKGADAVLLHAAGSRLSAKAVEAAIGSLGNLPGGILLDNAGTGNTAPLMKTGCDFVVFTADSLVRAIPPDEAIGKILRIEPSLEDSLIRVINSLPVDAVFTTKLYQTGNTMDWHHLMSLQRLGIMLTKPLLATVPPDIAAGELQAIREADVKGLIIEADASRPDTLPKISHAISQLPPPTARKPGKVEALLPSTGGFQETITPDEEEEEYE